jgi:hypothetical protein
VGSEVDMGKNSRLFRQSGTGTTENCMAILGEDLGGARAQKETPEQAPGARIVAGWENCPRSQSGFSWGAPYGLSQGSGAEKTGNSPYRNHELAKNPLTAL